MFRLHLASEPSSLDPGRMRGSAHGYLQNQLWRNLFSLDPQGQLRGELATECVVESRKGVQNHGALKCKIRQDLKWSDGSALAAEDLRNSYLRLLNPKNLSPRADMLFALEGAQQLFAGKLRPEEFKGIEVQGPQTLIFNIADYPLTEFIYLLSHPTLAPIKKTSEGFLFSGPYEVQTWSAGKSLLLKPNRHYWQNQRTSEEDFGKIPNVEFYFIEEDSVALRLFEEKKLSFLRRLPTLLIPKWRTHPEFFEIDVFRMDYFGFSPLWQKNEALRRSIAENLDYEAWQRVLFSRGRPGCIGFPSFWKKNDLCYNFSKKEHRQKIPSSWTISYSTQGGEDNRRVGEWMQDQFLRKFSTRVRVKGYENKLYTELLRRGGSDLFRRGFSPDRPTCMALLENFSKKNPENFLKFSDPSFEKLLEKMRSVPTKAKVFPQDLGSIPEGLWSLCHSALEILINKAYLIPTGPYSLSILSGQDFEGWSINTLNQLDLTKLRSKPKP